MGNSGNGDEQSQDTTACSRRTAIISVSAGIVGTAGCTGSSGTPTPARVEVTLNGSRNSTQSNGLATPTTPVEKELAAVYSLLDGAASTISKYQISPNSDEVTLGLSYGTNYPHESVSSDLSTAKNKLAGISPREESVAGVVVPYFLRVHAYLAASHNVILQLREITRTVRNAITHLLADDGPLPNQAHNDITTANDLTNGLNRHINTVADTQQGAVTVPEQVNESNELISRSRSKPVVEYLNKVVGPRLTTTLEHMSSFTGAMVTYSRGVAEYSKSNLSTSRELFKQVKSAVEKLTGSAELKPTDPSVVRVLIKVPRCYAEYLLRATNEYLSAVSDASAGRGDLASAHVKEARREIQSGKVATRNCLQ